MSSKKHSKKRNSSLLYELLTRKVAECVIVGDRPKTSTTLKIIKRSFTKKSEIYKEMRLAQSLLNTTVTSRDVAIQILSEARRAARNHDPKKLDHEKSLLIRNINHSLNESSFYDTKIDPDKYRMMATIQTLFNDWREGDGTNFDRQVLYEDHLIEWLVSVKPTTQEHILLKEDTTTVKLAERMMFEKINQKYREVLLPRQHTLAAVLVLATSDADEKLVEAAKQISSNLKRVIAEKKNTIESPFVNEKLESVEKSLDGETYTVVDDQAVCRHMMYEQLAHELCSEEKK